MSLLDTIDTSRYTRVKSWPDNGAVWESQISPNWWKVWTWLPWRSLSYDSLAAYGVDAYIEDFLFGIGPFQWHRTQIRSSLELVEEGLTIAGLEDHGKRAALWRD